MIAVLTFAAVFILSAVQPGLYAFRKT